MKEEKIQFYPRLSSLDGNWQTPAPLSESSEAEPPKSEPPNSEPRLEPSTCTEAETFALRVLDDSMQPEFRRGCIIIIDPTGLATDGCYVLAKMQASEEYLFRQLTSTGDGTWQLTALNAAYTATPEVQVPEEIVGVIVQRAGTRRRYHKHYG